MPLKIRFSEISEAGSRFEMKDNSWVPSEMSADSAPARAEITLTRKSDTDIELQGRLNVDIQLVCDRCLVNFMRHLDLDMHLLLRYADREHWRLHELESVDADLEIVALDEPIVDLEDLLRQQLLLSLPVKMLCRENCRGVCAQCGVNLNEKGCGCAVEQKKSPFAVLAGLKKNE